MNLLSIDPGKKNIAFAYFQEPSYELIDCGYIEFENLYELREEFRMYSNYVIVCEVPQVYKLGLSKGDPEDLIAVAVTAGACLSLSKVSMAVKPHMWKSNIDKKVHNARTLQDLSGEALRMLTKVKRSKQHNVLDALALGQWFLKRNEKNLVPTC